jgi:high-affinity nickel-transport protein
MQDSGFLLITMAFLLGIRHGFDLDHLATIDGIIRIVSTQRQLAKIVGCLFSLGHGLVVVVISLLVGSGFKLSHVPMWLDGFGNSISIAFLFIFGTLNLWNVFQASSQSPLPTSFKNYLTKKLIQKKGNPFFIILTGALFALSFDTVSQVVLFSLSARTMAGCLFSGLLGLVFTLGMMMSDGLNGLFVSKIVQRADNISLVFSRLAGFIIASFSLSIAVIGLIKMNN